MKKLSKLPIIIIALALQGCTVAYYSLQNKIEGPTARPTACDFKYSIKLESGSYTNTYGMHPAAQKRLRAMQDKYIKTTEEVLRDKGCKATYVETADESTFDVQIKHLAQISALPQEWLTGLSFGLIPSWGTRHSEFAYSFKNKLTDKAHTYTVDTKSYNHLVLFPVFWISFFTLDENSEYKTALTNFLTHD